MNTTPHIEKISSVIAQHDEILAAAERHRAAERDDLAARQAADVQRMEPVSQSAASLKSKLNTLTEKRDLLTEKLRIGRHQLAGQLALKEEFDKLVGANFGHEYAEKNPGVFLEIFTNRPASLLALEVVPRLQKWIADTEEELAETESAMVELANTVSLPKEFRGART